MVADALDRDLRRHAPDRTTGDGRYRRDRLGDARAACAARRPAKRSWSSTPSGFPPEGDDCDAAPAGRGLQAGLAALHRLSATAASASPAAASGRTPTACASTPTAARGDYLASGIDGMEIHVHGNAQDQLGQIMKARQAGRSTATSGQTFMYGAKGGEVYVLGNAAGRPLINAVGKPRVVINGTCLDFLAESFMAGDPLNGGGFVILNGIDLRRPTAGSVPLETPYPGSNLFSPRLGRRHLRPRSPYDKHRPRAAQRRCRSCAFTRTGLGFDSALSEGE
ncbi:MAG: hypothetical protein MZW92_06565 [Comamonadaceae bacterium]|nr:hypothetical protein [Comamonadaceae bacterium]